MRSTLAAILLLLTAIKANSATLVGEGSFQNTGDLTVVETGSQRLEWLDVSLTVNQDLSTALNTYSPFGFAWATIGQMTDLLDAFDTAYVSNGGFAPLTMSATSRSQFISLLGATFGSDTALGYYDANGILDGALCVKRNSLSSFGCSPLAWVNEDFDLPLANPNRGLFLVRTEDLSQVPVPPGLALLVTGLCIAFGARRNA